MPDRIAIVGARECSAETEAKVREYRVMRLRALTTAVEEATRESLRAAQIELGPTRVKAAARD